MNVLGHLAMAKGASPMVQLGAMLPDVLSYYHRRLKAPRLLARESHPGWRAQDWQALKAGVAFHVEVDRRFHAAPLFLEGYQALCVLLRQGQEAHRRGDSAGHTSGDVSSAATDAAANDASMRPPASDPAPPLPAKPLRPMLTAHVLHELELDRLLLQADPHLTQQFHQLITRYAEALGTLVKESAHDAPVPFPAFVQRLRDGALVGDFHTPAGVLRRMERIQRRYLQRGFYPSERVILQQHLVQRAPRATAQLAAFIANNRDALPSAMRLTGSIRSSGTTLGSLAR